MNESKAIPYSMQVPNNCSILLLAGSDTTYLIGCARSCLNTEGCHAISYECKRMETTRHGICKLVSEEGSAPYMVVSDSTMCYMKVKDRYPLNLTPTITLSVTSSISASQGTSFIPQTSTKIVTLPVTSQILTSAVVPQGTTSMFPVIVDMVDNVQNMCTQSSQRDIAVITTEAVYIYDDKDSLKHGSCKSVAVTSLFEGFGDLPDVTQWNAVLTVQKSYIDVYSASKIYRWSLSSTKLVPMVGFPKFRYQYLMDIKGSNPNYLPNSPTWAVQRETLGSLDFYAYEKTGNNICFYSNQSPHESRFNIRDTSQSNQNGNPINPWMSLPSNTVALTAAENDGIDFVGITDNYEVLYYNLEYPYDLRTVPTVTHEPLVF